MSESDESGVSDDYKSIEEIVHLHAENDYPSGRHIYKMITDTNASKLIAFKIKRQVYLG